MNIEYGSEADGSQKKNVPAVKTQGANWEMCLPLERN